jgi:RNA polymerase sigma-70 factor (ECF subfamily)
MAAQPRSTCLYGWDPKILRRICPARSYNNRKTDRSDGVLMTQLADEDLLARIGKGDHEAFRLLVDRHLTRSLALAERIVGERSEAEDVVQESFLRVWLHAARWQPKGARFGTWFYRVVVNRCLDIMRRAKPLPLETVENMAGHEPGAAAQLYRRQVARRVKAAMAQLPGRQRAALALCYYDEMSQLEAAEVLGVTVGALESLLVRARRQLRTLLLADSPDLGNAP